MYFPVTDSAPYLKIKCANFIFQFFNYCPPKSSISLATDTYWLSVGGREFYYRAAWNADAV